eukprot:TRINITY_DN4497_c0_g1_i4.p1 TRINITY_DN4497_c0_g1~~TRINITY_DN4497_c0_g1_i4.p1  ORF type:complete len:522 (-),score=109.32 TRINITY_DN4497_c0_g1_i4:18-1583(-)
MVFALMRALIEDHTHVRVLLFMQAPAITLTALPGANACLCPVGEAVMVDEAALPVSAKMVANDLDGLKKMVDNETPQWLWNTASWEAVDLRPYDPPVQREIEHAYRQGMNTVKIMGGRWTLDLISMRQHNPTRRNRQRGIYRDPPVFDVQQEVHHQEHLVQEIMRGNCVIFLGAGFSIPAGGHNWGSLLQTVAERAVAEAGADPMIPTQVGQLCSSWQQDDMNQAAQLIEDTLETLHAANGSSPLMTDLVADEVQRPRDNARAAHFPLDASTILQHREEYPVMASRIELVDSTPFIGILTTNYNCVTPGSSGAAPLSRRPEGSPVRCYNSLLRGREKPQRGDKPVLQIHGTCLEPQTIVLTTEGYRRLLHGEPGYSAFLKSVMATRTILYFGFSFTDGYLNELRSETMSMLNDLGDLQEHPLAYAIINDKTKEECDYFRQHEGVQFLSFDSKAHGFGAADRYLYALNLATNLSLIHISEPTRLLSISYAVFCLKKKKKKYGRHFSLRCCHIKTDSYRNIVV